MIAERCLLCDEEFLSCKPAVRICPRCELQQDAEFSVAVEYSDPWRWSRPVLQERLTVTGREDS